jgi:hypothetical protein
MFRTGEADLQTDAVIVNGTNGSESIRVAGQAFTASVLIGGLGQDDLDGGPGDNTLIQ